MLIAISSIWYILKKIRSFIEKVLAIPKELSEENKKK